MCVFQCKCVNSWQGINKVCRYDNNMIYNNNTSHIKALSWILHLCINECVTCGIFARVYKIGREKLADHFREIRPIYFINEPGVQSPRNPSFMLFFTELMSSCFPGKSIISGFQEPFKTSGIKHHHQCS